MVNTALLKNEIKKSGKKYKHLADKIGIVPYSLSKKIENKAPFYTEEVKILCDEIGINDKDLMLAIFFKN